MNKLSSCQTYNDLKKGFVDLDKMLGPDLPKYIIPQQFYETYFNIMAVKKYPLVQATIKAAKQGRIKLLNHSDPKDLSLKAYVMPDGISCITTPPSPGKPSIALVNAYKKTGYIRNADKEAIALKINEVALYSYLQTGYVATILAEKGMIVYDQKTWDLHYEWFDERRAVKLQDMIRAKNAESPYAEKSIPELLDSLGMTKEEDDKVLPTTTGLLFVGNDRALRELPFYEVKYIRYDADGSYTPYEYRGNIIEVAQQCFAQLKAEIKKKEFVFGLYREYIEDYSEIVLRELLINDLVHRDISRQQVVEIRKYEDYIEFESPGTFPQGITVDNYLRKTNPRNPNVIDIMREIGFAEKAGSGFDKIFTELLSKGKHLPEPEETDTSVIFRIRAEICMEKLIELSLQYQAQTGEALHLDQLLVLNEIVVHGKVKLTDLEKAPHVSTYRLRNVLDRLQKLEFIESTGKTSGQAYILHVSKRKTTDEKIDYVMSKKQEKARQKEAILRYLDSVETINNTETRILLKLTEASRSMVSRLFASLIDDGEIEKVEDSRPNDVRYRRKKK